MCNENRLFNQSAELLYFHVLKGLLITHIMLITCHLKSIFFFLDMINHKEPLITFQFNTYGENIGGNPVGRAGGRAILLRLLLVTVTAHMCNEFLATVV